MTEKRGTIIDSMPPLAPPLKRLSRPAEPPAFRLTPRDLSIVAAVSRYRFLTSKQIAQLDGGSHVQVLRRLKALWAHGFLDRPLHQHAYLAAWSDEGNKPLAYAVGRRGAKLLKAQGLAVDDKLDWTQKNNRVGALHLAHTLETAAVMLHFARAADAAGLHLIDHHELLPFMPERTRALHNPFRMRVTVSLPQSPRPHAIGVVPDRLFSIAQGDMRRNYALELDRGHESVNAKSLSKSSFRRKLLGYFHAWREKRHSEVWGFQSFRVLTIAPSEKRIASMVAAQDEVTGGAASGLFLYATPADIAAEGALGPTWRTAKGERVALK
jgi:hypothetical protein